MRCVPLREVLLILQAHLRALLHNQVYFKLKWSDCGFFLIEKKKKNSCKFRPKVVWISEDQEQIHPCFLTPLGKFSSNSPHISLPEPWLGAGWSKVQALLCTCTGLVTVPGYADALAQMDRWMCLGMQQLHAGSSPQTHILIFFEVRGIHLLYSCFTHQIMKVILKYFD